MPRTCLISKLRLLHPLRTRWLSINSHNIITKQQQHLLPALFNVTSKIQQQQQQQQQQRSLSTSKKRGFSVSSSSALVEDIDDIDDDASYNDDDDQSSRQRPRLRDLRQRLKNETVAPPLTSFTNKIHDSDNNSPPTRTTITTTTPPPPKTTLHWKDALLLATEKISTLPSQPSPLNDPYGRFHNYLRLSLSERCNLRCIYCMPPEGIPLSPPPSLLSTPEILTLAETFRSFGVTKIRLTGGEPTLRNDLPKVLEGLRDVGFSEGGQLGMTTNGVALSKHLDTYVSKGLNRVNVSLDTLKPSLFAKLSRRPEGYFHRVWEGLEMATRRFTREELMTKINVVVMKGVNDDEVGDFVRLLNVFPDVDVRFIEYMPFTDNGWEMDKWVSYRDLLAKVAKNDGLDLVELPSDDPNDTTKWYTTKQHHRRNNNGGRGRIGFITSMSQPFCNTCNRLRLGADGSVKVCLFDGDSTVNLRDAVRDGATRQDLEMLVWLALSKKRFMLGGNESPEGILENAKSNRPMTLIGG